jgi:hypothetical protein
MLPRPILLAVDEADGLPVPVDRGALVVDEPPASPISWTVGKSRSVSILAAFFGQAIHSPSAGASVFFRAAKRRSSSARVVVNSTSTSTPGFEPSFLPSGVAE